MKTENTSNNLFTGKFVLLGYDTYELEHGWVSKRRDEYDGSYDWEFKQMNVLTFPSGNIAYEGIFCSAYKSYPPKASTYTYYPSENTLCINHYGYLDNGEFNIYAYERYRVEQISQTELWLYNLICFKESNNYKDRTIMRKC